MNSPLLIAIAGHPLTGKDTAAHYIVEKYHTAHVSMSDLIRQYIVEHNLGDPNRDLLGATGDALRKEHGGDYLIVLALDKNKPPLVISGMRAIGEAETFKKRGGTLIAITTPIEERYRRARERGTLKDDVSLEKFKAQTEREALSDDPAKNNVEGVIRMADYTIENTGTLQDFFAKIDALLK